MAHVIGWSHVQRVGLHLRRYFVAVSGWCRQAERQVVIGLAFKRRAEQVKVSQGACIDVGLEVDALKVNQAALQVFLSWQSSGHTSWHSQQKRPCAEP
jgi:hypothetical protein